MTENVRDLLPFLNDDGRLFVSHMRTLHGEILSRISTDDDDLTTPMVRLISQLTYGERMRQFGIDCVPRRQDASGKYGPQGHIIPTEDYIARVIACYGDTPERRTISLDPYVHRVRHGRMSLANAINAAGRDLREMLTAGMYQLR